MAASRCTFRFVSFDGIAVQILAVINMCPKGVIYCKNSDMSHKYMTIGNY